MIQEAHGTAEEMAETRHWFDEKWIVRSNPSCDRNVGGTISLFRKSLLDPEATVLDEHVLVPGRISRVCVKTPDATAVYWNCHNYGMSRPQMLLVNAKLEEDISNADADPMHFTVFVTGDFNFHAPGEAPIRVSSPAESLTAAVAAVGLHQNTWQSLLCNLTEVEQGDATRFDHRSLSTSRIDRMCNSVPA